MARGKRKAADSGVAAAGHNSGVLLEEQFHDPYEAIAAAESLSKEASGKKSASFKAFEQAGGNKEALRIAMKLRTKSPYEQKKLISDALRYARFMDLPVGTSLTLDQIDAIRADVEKADDDAAAAADGATVH